MASQTFNLPRFSFVSATSPYYLSTPNLAIDDELTQMSGRTVTEIRVTQLSGGRASLRIQLNGGDFTDQVETMGTATLNRSRNRNLRVFTFGNDRSNPYDWITEEAGNLLRNIGSNSGGWLLTIDDNAPTIVRNMYRGTRQIQKRYRGSTEIIRTYRGTNLIYGQPV